jgi:hypothetical protein
MHSVVVISDNQSTKHRVTLFHYVVSSPIAPPTSMSIIVNGLLTAAKIQNSYNIVRFFAKKLLDLLLISNKKASNRYFCLLLQA